MSIKVRHRKLRGGRRETVYLDYYDNGRRWLEYLGLYLTGKRANAETDRETLRLAENIAAKRCLELASEAHGFAMQAKQKADFIEYCRKLGESKRSPNTRVVWRNAIGHLQSFTGGALQFGKLNHSLLTGFRDYLIGKVSQNSALVYLARVKTACRQAVKAGILSRDPALDVSIKKQATRRQFLTFEELEKLAATHCSNRDTKAAFLFSAFSGLRYSDVKALTWSKVKQANSSCELEFSQTKTGDPETLPLSAEAAAILKGQHNARVSPRVKSKVTVDAVFKLGAQQTIDKAIRQWVKRAGIQKKISFHNARHTFATLSLTNGIDIYTVSKLLGHKRLETTEIYAKVIDQKKRQAVGMLPRLSGGRR
jgi:integrase